MQCEICNTIERLGLDPSAHDLWFCCDPKPAVSTCSLRSHLREFVLNCAVRRQLAYSQVLDRRKHWIELSLRNFSSLRQHYITLGL
jgi:hypothetical protein